MCEYHNSNTDSCCKFQSSETALLQTIWVREILCFVLKVRSSTETATYLHCDSHNRMCDPYHYHRRDSVLLCAVGVSGFDICDRVFYIDEFDDSTEYFRVFHFEELDQFGRGELSGCH